MIQPLEIVCLLAEGYNQQMILCMVISSAYIIILVVDRAGDTLNVD